eukprot:gene10172-8077_t
MRFGFYAYISINTFADLEDVPPEENVPSYSSFGPTEDGRMKPEIVAPGATVSAWTNWGGSELGAYRNDNCANKLFLESLGPGPCPGFLSPWALGPVLGFLVPGPWSLGPGPCPGFLSPWALDEFSGPGPCPVCS